MRIHKAPTVSALAPGIEDIGLNGGFNEALKSRIGTFLQWDTGAPAGYIGDPNVDHTIIGGINNQNFFRVEGLGIGTGSCGPNCAQTDFFSLMGKQATIAGVVIGVGKKSGMSGTT